MEYKTTDTELTSVANAIRTKGGTTEPLTYPNEFISAIQNIPTGGGANLQTKSKTYTPTTSQQTDTVSPDTGYDGLSSVNVTVNAIPTGSAGTPTATKGTVSNHSVSVTPSVTNTTGYITGGTKTGTSVSVSASELVSGSQTVAGNGTYDVTNLSQLIVDTPTMNLPSATSSTPTGTNKANILPSTSQQYLNIPAGLNDTARYYQIIGMDLAPLNVTQNGTYKASDVDITGFNTVTVNVSGGTPSLQTKSKTYTPTTSQQTESITADNGYDGLNTVNVTVNAMPSGTEGTPTATKGSVSNHSVTVTPSVTNSAGYIQGGTKTGNGVIVTANELASGNLPITANANNINVVGYATVSVNVPGSTPNLQTKTRTYTPSITEQREVISADSGYDGLLAVGITVDPMPTLTLPNVASMSSTGTRKAKIYQSNYTQYWNIGTGYHAVEEYYEIPPLLVDTKTITTNGTYNAIDEDLDGYSSVTVNVSGVTSTCDTKTMTNSDNQATSIQFTGLSGEPKWFFVRCTSQLTRSSSYSYYFVTDIRYNGTNHNGNYYRRSNGSYYNDTSHYSHTYSNGTLTVSSSANRGAAGGSFYNGNYELVYIY